MVEYTCPQSTNNHLWYSVASCAVDPIERPSATRTASRFLYQSPFRRSNSGQTPSRTLRRSKRIFACSRTSGTNLQPNQKPASSRNISGSYEFHESGPAEVPNCPVSSGQSRIEGAPGRGGCGFARSRPRPTPSSPTARTVRARSAHRASPSENRSRIALDPSPLRRGTVMRSSRETLMVRPGRMRSLLVSLGPGPDGSRRADMTGRRSACPSQ